MLADLSYCTVIIPNFMEDGGGVVSSPALHF